MTDTFDIINGWEVRGREDGGYGIYDAHGMVSGPHWTKTAAIGAALELPVHHSGMSTADDHYVALHRARHGEAR